jgi:ParB-like chromosome segregation protein Spo0J
MNINIDELEFHELANEFPLISEEKTKELAGDIAINGLIERIVLYEGKILDGRNRYRACQMAGYDLDADDVILFEEHYPDTDPVLFVISRNIMRRHLSVAQRAAVASRFRALMGRRKPGPAKARSPETAPGDEQSRPAEPLLQRNEAKSRSPEIIPEAKSRSPEIIPPPVKERTAKVAAAVGVSGDAVEDAAYVEKHDPEGFKELQKGTKSLQKAVREAQKRIEGVEIDAAWERIQEVCGKSFAAAIAEDQINALMTAKNLIVFSELADEKMQALVPALRLGWKLERALLQLDKEITTAMTFAQLLDQFAFRGSKRLEFELDELRCVMTKAQRVAA